MNRYTTPSSDIPFIDAVWRQALPPSSAIEQAAALALPVAASRQAQDAIQRWEHYSPTPLHALRGLANHFRLGAVYCKDEGQRLGLGSFKALGGAYAVANLAQEKGTAITVTCATEGNHGRSVAWGAQRAGVPCVIFLHEGVSQAREEAIARYGAQIRRVAGNYDDAVRTCAEVAEQEGWQIVSDTTWEGYQEIPRQVMAGYSLIAKEVSGQIAQPPTHVFVQAGVGGIAASLMASLQRAWPGAAMRFIVVEPRGAACILASALAGGRLTAVSGPFDTISAGLACGEPSPAVLDLLMAGTSMFLALDDVWLKQAMRQYAQAIDNDASIVAGASGAAGLAGLLAVLSEEQLSEALGLDAASRVLLINTENDTDPAAYQEIVTSQATDR
ncbi:MAG TPA: diaminopropionate ammonia-lyase [Burkholderiaceae bacterium]|nr:diaminopropionate ammonia-lyase [Burkholderiaceae bacterium]